MTREEIKNIVRHVFHFYEVNAENCNWADMNEACGEIFKALEQEPKTGHWIWQTEDIYRCSECGNDIRVKEVMNIPQYVRCPMCEAKMIEPQESEEL